MKQRAFDVVDGGRFDVIVVGGGSTGIAAAISAARLGAKTAIVEYYGFLGGNSTTGLPWMAYHNLSGQQVIGGVAMEFIERLREVGGATDFYMDPVCSSTVGVNPHWWKVVSMREVKQAGVEVFLHSLVVDVALEAEDGANNISGIYVQSRGGLHHLSADVLIDCTDSGAIASGCGVEMIRGRPEDGKVQVASWTITVGGIDFAPLMEYFREVPSDIRPFPIENIEALLEQMETAEIFIMGAFRSLIKKATAQGMQLSRVMMPGVAIPGRGEIMTVATCVEDVDPTDPDGFTKAEQEGMRQTEQWIEFMQRYVPGCEKCYLSGTPHQIGLRETSHMVGDYTLTGEDLMSGRQFDDVIALGGYHIDIHAPSNEGDNAPYQGPPTYQIPFRSLLPKGVEGLLVAGRAISATHEAMASTRVIPIGMAQGQAAGTAAAMAAKQRVPPRALSVKRLQEQLKRDDAILSTEGLPRHPQSVRFQVASTGEHVSNYEA
jgi:hypothetical protein